MCGIVGFNWDDKTLIEKMSSKLEHRGPDQKGFFIDKNISLGHRRLSIIDLSEKGKQPMFNEDRTLSVIFNGEIYNFKEIKEILEKKGHKFYSDTDTEVILHAYEEYKEKCIEMFNGMFAFAIYDSENKEIFIVRDRLGVKPLYYYFKDSKFIFASEIKAILEYDIKKEVNLDALNNYLAFKFIPTHLTIFKNIYKLEPGHYLIFKDNKITIKKYWDLNFEEIKKSEKYYIDKILSLLKDSVKKRLMSDVPLGVFLSGGLDSSLITALMSKFEDNVKTFSVGFSDDKHNELKYANQIARLFNTNHHEILVDFKNIRDLLPKITYYLDEPMSDWASIPTYLISQLAKKKVTVALAGDGGDELFVGYRQSILNNYCFYFNLIPKFSYSYLKDSSKIKKMLLTCSIKNNVKRAANWITVFNENERGNLLLNDVKKNINFKNLDCFKKYANKIKGYSSLNQNLYFETKTWLPEDLLMKIDKTSMMCSLEARVPFLDYRLVELMSKVPTNLKIKNFRTKYLLKKAALEILPKNIVYRKKHGFTLPTCSWFRNELKDYSTEILSNKELHKYLNKDYINKILKLHQSKKENFDFKICNLVSFGLWHKIYIEEDKIDIR